jgi:hypothetical protein
MALHQIAVRLRKLAPEFSMVNIVPAATTVSFDTKFEATVDRLAFVVVPQAEATPTTEQVSQGKNAAGTAATWSTTGKVWALGRNRSIYMEGPKGLLPNTAYKLCGSRHLGGNVYSNVITENFTTLDAAPQLVATVPSNGWKLVWPTSTIRLQFDAPVTLGTGLITLRDKDVPGDVETFNVATGVGSGGGTVVRATTVYANDTVLVTPGSSLTIRKNYAVRVAATAVKSASGALAYAGIADDTTYAFRVKHSDRNAKVIMGTDEGFAFDLTDDSMFVKDTVTPANDYDGTFMSRLTKTGTWTASENGMRVSNSVYATMSTSTLPMRGNGTLILDVLGAEYRAGAGGGINNHSPFYFYGKVGYSSHFLMLSKFDYGENGWANVGLDMRNQNAANYYPILNMPMWTFPMVSFGVVGVSWNSTTDEAVLFTDSAASSVKTYPTGVPDSFTTLRIGIAPSPAYFDLRAGVYYPDYMTANDAQARAAALLAFRST